MLVWEKPERIEGAREAGKIRANFKVSILLRKVALAGDKTRGPTARVTILSGLRLSSDGERVSKADVTAFRRDSHAQSSERWKARS